MPTYEQPELPFDPPLTQTTITPPSNVSFFPEDPILGRRVSDLEKRVDALENAKPGRRGVPITVSEKGVCGIDPTCDSATCEKASVYRWQKGCRGTACEKEYKGYYSMYRKKRRGSEEATVTHSENLEQDGDWLAEA